MPSIVSFLVQIFRKENADIFVPALWFSMSTTFSKEIIHYSDEINNFFDRLSLIQKARDDFFNNGIEPSPEIIAPDILSSWRRSLEKGLDPNVECFSYLNDDELRVRLEENVSLIEAADPVLTMFSRRFGSNSFVIDLYDSSMCLLKRYSEIAEREFLSSEIRPGLLRSEDVAGCTSLSICLSRKQASQLIGGEHFSSRLSDKMCTASRIFRNNKIVGFINVMDNTLRNSSDMVNMLVVLSYLIENNLKQQDLRNELADSAAINAEVISASSNGVLIVSNEGSITTANDNASRILGIPAAAIIGKKTTEIFAKDQDFDIILGNEDGFRNQEIVSFAGGKPQRLIGSSVPIRNADGDINHYLVYLNDMKSFKKIVQTIGGWTAKSNFNDIIGNDPVFRQAVEFARQTAVLDNNTLIVGESGTGKELFASSIHNASSFASGPFVSVNCGSIPSNLLESELFGYEGGAFTGSNKKGQIGKFELADGGTIFLDEINSIPFDMQVKLLRVLQEKTICRVGGTSNIELHLKIIAASNEELSTLVNEGRFRDDLFFRLNVISIHIPPLYQHPNDIPPIAENILQRFSFNGVKHNISKDAYALMMQYRWPGNIRELENVIERAVITANLRGSDRIEAWDLDIDQQLIVGQRHEYMPIHNYSFASENYTDTNMKTMEKNRIIDALKNNNLNISAAAKELGISRNTLYRRIHQYSIKI